MNEMDTLAAIRDGFEPLFRTSPFLDVTGPYFYKKLESGFMVGIEIAEKHGNASGTAHGGLIATLADVSIGYVTAFSQVPALRMTTANLSIDYVGSARVGEWLESRVTIQKVGRKLAFASAEIWTEQRLVAAASAIFSVLEEAKHG